MINAGRHYSLLLMSLCLIGCYPSKPRKAFETYYPPAGPDYSQLYYWAAHPEKLDSADLIPDQRLSNGQEDAEADVFFLHPTTYVGSLGQNQWNAPVDDDKLNEDTDDGAIQYQATIFNGCYRVFAPRYRQAHYQTFFTDKQKDAQMAMELAYLDVKAAFEYYLEHHHAGRPILIAGHSQGSAHAIRLLQDFFDGQQLAEKLVAAYIPGMKVAESDFDQIFPCYNPSETQCVNAWRTLRYGHNPVHHEKYYSDDLIVVNPLSWKTTGEDIPEEKNQGAVLLNFYDGLSEGLASAKIENGYLWTRKPKFKGSFWIRTKNYHRGDFNLYYNGRTTQCLSTTGSLSGVSRRYVIKRFIVHFSP